MELSNAIKGVSGSLVVVDDALGKPNFEFISDEALTSQFNRIDEDQSVFDELAQLLEVDGSSMSAEALMAVVEQKLELLWGFYISGDHQEALNALFFDFKSSYFEKRRRVDALIDTLNKLFGVAPSVFSDLDSARDALRVCAIAFVDYYVDETIVSADEATQRHVQVKDYLCSGFEYNGARWPKLVFLMSSKLPGIEGLADFRARTGIKSAFFYALDKRDLEHDFVSRKLGRCIEEYFSAVQLNNYLETVHHVVDKAAAQIGSEIERLELHDLTALKSLRLDAESESVQSYLTWLVSEALAAKIRSAIELQASLIPKDSKYVPIDGKLLPRSVLFELYSDIAVASFSQSNDAPIVLGDVLELLESHVSNELLLVIAPACDLARCSLNYEVLCVKGILHDTSNSLSELLGKAYAFGKGKVVLKRIVQSEPVYSRISLDPKKICTVRYADLQDSKKYSRLARLSEMFAQEIKELALSQVSRVGTPIDPSFSVALHAFVRLKLNLSRDNIVEFQADLADEDFVSAVLAMGREASEDPESSESSSLEKTVLFSAQFQEWMLDRLIPYREGVSEGVGKLDNLINLFGDKGNLRVSLGGSGLASLANGSVKIRYVDAASSDLEFKSALEVQVYPYFSV